MAELAGAACFKWSQDKAVLLGVDPFEFRTDYCLIWTNCAIFDGCSHHLGGRFNRTVPAFHGINPGQQAFMEDVVQYVPGPQAWDKYMADALGK